MDIAAARRLLLLVAGLALTAGVVTAQQASLSTSIQGPKDLDVSATFTAKQAPSTEVEVVFAGDDNDAAGSGPDGGFVNVVKQQLGARLSQAGIDTSKLTEFGASLRASASNLLSLLEATRGAYEKTLVSLYGLLLDNTKETRKVLEDGNAVIDTINVLRGAECEPASFTPPTAEPARITGAGGSLEITTGSCTLTRAAAPLQLEYVLSCTEPGVTWTYNAPTYTSRYIAAASATTEECTVTRKYGVESETTITLFDPASFFVAAEGEEEEAEAASGLRDGAAGNSSGGINKAAAWYKTLFPIAGAAGERAEFMPAKLAEVVEEAIKQTTLEMTLNYTPFSMKANLQEAADATIRTLAKYYDVKQKSLKLHKKQLDEWFDTDARLEVAKEVNFAGHLRESMAAVNVSSLFDGLFMKTASRLMAGAGGGGGKVAAAVAGAAADVARLQEQRPLRTLLAKARDGAGEPVSVSVRAELEQMLGARGSLQALLDGAKPGSLLQLLARDKQVGGQLQRLADTLAAAAGRLTGKPGKEQQG